MPISIGKKKIKNHFYYVARECRRINGKPRIVFQKYLGKAESIIAAVDRKPPAPTEVDISDFGAVAALFDIARKLRLSDLIDEVANKRDQGLSVGQYMLVAAINRCVAPTSKVKIGEWFIRTPLRRLVPALKSQLSSKRFWDNMQLLDEEAIHTIEKKVSEKLVSDFGVDTRCLFYDATNFFTFIDSFNQASTLAKRGHSKEKRDNLRIVGLAMLASIDFNIPLFHDTYPGNRPDSKEFSSVINRLVDRYKIFAQSVDKITMIFDKGNNSEENMTLFDVSPFHFVGSLKLNQCPEVLDINRAWFTPLKHPSLYGVSAFRYPRKMLGRDRTIIVTYNEALFLTQSQSLLLEIRKRTRSLNELGRSILKPQSGKRRKKTTLESLRKQAEGLLKGQYVKDIVRVDVSETNGHLCLLYSVDHAALQKIQDERLGITILFTDNHDWTDEEIVLAYRGQTGIENCFKTMKNPHFVSWSPMFHWTDHNVRVHAFYCILALILASLLQREVSRAGISLTIPALLAELQSIREVAISYETGKPQFSISKLTELQEKLFQMLKLDQYLASQ